MPIVSATLTERQWRELDQEHNIKPLSTRELAFTGLWIVDGLSAEDEAIVAALVPPIPRWIIRNVLVRGYRKTMFRVWRLPEHSKIKMKLSGRTSRYADASPETVWRILTDVPRVASGAASATPPPGSTGRPTPPWAPVSVGPADPDSRSGAAHAPSTSATRRTSSATAPRSPSTRLHRVALDSPAGGNRYAYRAALQDPQPAGVGRPAPVGTHPRAPRPQVAPRVRRRPSRCPCRERDGSHWRCPGGERVVAGARRPRGEVRRRERRN